MSVAVDLSSEECWALAEHVCRACLGRLLVRRPVERCGPWVYRCSNCGVEAEASGAGRPPICACNMKVGRKDAGIRCVRNDRPRPELLCEIVAREIP